jgi:hypothetical protein
MCLVLWTGFILCIVSERDRGRGAVTGMRERSGRRRRMEVREVKSRIRAARAHNNVASGMSYGCRLIIVFN